MKQYLQKFHHQKNRGFVILFAILVSAIILLISVGIFNIAQKEAVLSSYSRESQKALFAADAAIECAFFYDLNPPLNGNGVKKTFFPVDTPTDTTIDCSDTSIPVYYLSGESSNDYDYLYVFSHQNSLFADAGCGFVLVEKRYVDENEDPDPSLGIDTRVTAVGFNECSDDGTPNYNHPSILERRLSASYVAV